MPASPAHDRARVSPRLLDAAARDPAAVLADLGSFPAGLSASEAARRVALHGRNVLGVLGASIFLPFVPMTPLQILTTNLLYDCSQVPIPGDHVDPELVARPRPWSLTHISRCGWID